TAGLAQVNALVQRIGGVSGGVVPFRKIQGRVHPARDLAQAARGEPEGAPHRVGFEWLTETGDGGIGGNTGVRGSERVWHGLSQIPRAPEVERHRQRDSLLLWAMTLRAYARRLWVHEVAVEVSVQVARLSRTLSGPGAGPRADQLVRAALSVSSNIAEACGRGTIPEFRKFLQYARGSAQETLTQLRVEIGRASCRERV